MARQEATNIFSDALMSDLHPINTPKSVLTDCLNGTYITYNGNEFILQNDMGNYKLKNCKLPVNFIPVGVKGYADILYIVSYNPLTKKVEIGSYPAPQSIFSNKESNASPEEDQLKPFEWTGTQTYEYLIDNFKQPLYIFVNQNEEDTKLYPGDEFWFGEGSAVPELAFVYQHLNFYIIDEDKKLYDIEDTELYTENNTLPVTKQKVFWETPGWLAAQYNLYVPDKFNLGLRSLNVPEFLTNSTNATTITDRLDEELPTTGFKVSMDLTTQTIISDRLFQTELLNRGWKGDEQTHKELLVRYVVDQSNANYGTFKGIVSSGDDYKVSVDPSIQQVIIDIPCRKHNYQDDIITAYTNDRAIWFMPALQEGQSVSDYPGKISIKAYPILKHIDKDSILRIVEFTQFTSEFSYSLNNLKDKNKIKIAESIYKWAIDDDSITVSFDIDGPFINVSNITGTYSFRQLLPNGEESKTDLISNEPITNLTLFGQNTFNIPIPINTNNNVYDVKENGVYVLEIKLEQGTEQLKTAKLIIITSKVFNDFFGTHDSYSSITPTEWLSKWWDYFSVTDVSINSLKYNFSGLNNEFTYRWSDENKDYSCEISELPDGNFAKLLSNIYATKMPSNHKSSDENANGEWMSSNTANFPTLEIIFSPKSNEQDGSKDYSVKENKLTGSLWTPAYTIRVELNQNGGNTLLELKKEEKVNPNENEGWEDLLTVPGLSNKITATAQNISVANYTESFPYITFLNSNGTKLPTQLKATSGRWLLHSYMLGTKRNIQVIVASDYLDETKDYNGAIESTRTKTSENKTIALTAAKNNFKNNFKQGFNVIPLAVVQLSTINVNNDSRIGWYAAENVIKSPSYLIDDVRSESNTSYIGYSGLVMQNSKKEPIYIDFGAPQKGTAYQQIANALYQLSRYGVRSYDDTYKTEYVPRLATEAADTSFRATLTRYNVEIILDSLNYKDSNGNTYNWLTSKSLTSDSYIGSNLINSEAVITERKTIDNVTLANSYTLNVNFSSSGIETYTQAISTFIDNNELDIQELQSNDTQEPLYYYENESEYNARLKQLNLENKWSSNAYTFGKDKPISTEDVKKFFGCTTKQFTLSNLIFDTSTNLKLIAGGRGQGDTKGHGQIETAWYEKLTLNT